MKQIYLLQDNKTKHWKEFTNKKVAIQYAKDLHRMNSHITYYVYRIVNNPWIGKLGELIYETK